MFPKASNKGFFKRASSWRGKSSKQKSGNSGSTAEGRLYKTSSLNDLSLQASGGSSVGADPSAAVEASFRNIQLGDAVPSGTATASSRIFDSSHWYQPAPSSSKGTKRLSRSSPQPTFQSHRVDDSQINNPGQDFQTPDPCRTIKSPEKRQTPPKACVDSPTTQNPFLQFGDRSPGDGSNLNRNRSSVRFSTGNTTRTSPRQSDPPNQLDYTPQACRSTSVKSPVSPRQSTGAGAARTSPMKKVSPKSCISCHGPLDTPTNPQLGGLDRPGTSRLPHSPPGTFSIYAPGQQQIAGKPPIYPSDKTDRGNPKVDPKFSRRNTARLSRKRHGTSPKQTSTDSFSSVSGFTEHVSVDTFHDYDVLADARRVLSFLVHDINHSLDVISGNTIFPGVVRRSFGWSTASNDPPQINVDSLPTNHETQLKIVEAFQSRCLEYREMVRNLAESILHHTNRFESSTVNSMASLYDDFIQLKANCLDFKVMCSHGAGDVRAGNLSNEMTLFVQNLCLNTMQMQNEVYLERLQAGFALIRAYCKLFRFMDACSCCIRK